ncbi:MAG: type II toxin-antitoxin system VapC family toxin [Nanoarchaeota archaeon]
MIYLDANIFLYPHSGEGPKAKACIAILKNLSENKINAFTSSLTWDEINYALRKILGKEKAIEQSRIFLETPNLVFLKVDEETINVAQDIIEKYAINPRDAIHAATAIINKAEGIVTDDSDFDKIKELKRVKI